MNKEYLQYLYDKVKGKDRVFIYALQLTHNGCREWEKFRPIEVAEFLGITADYARKKAKMLSEKKLLFLEHTNKNSRIRLRYEPLVTSFLKQPEHINTEVFTDVRKYGFIEPTSDIVSGRSQTQYILGGKSKKMFETSEELRELVLSMPVSPFNEYWLKKEFEKPGLMSTLNIYKYIIRYRLKINHPTLIGIFSSVKMKSKVKQKPLTESEQVVMVYLASKELLGRANFRDIMYCVIFHLGSNTSEYKEIMRCAWLMHQSSFWSNRVTRPEKYRNFSASITNVLQLEGDTRKQIETMLEQRPDLKPEKDAELFFRYHIQHLVPTSPQITKTEAKATPASSEPSTDNDLAR